MLVAGPKSWFPYGRSGGGQLCLLCFPYAGGAASVFRSWPGRLGSEIEVLPVELPGRGQRLAEPPLRSVEAIVSALLPIVPEVGDGTPIALFGHSFGGRVAFELARQLELVGVPPVLVVVACALPPSVPQGGEEWLGLPDEAFVARLERSTLATLALADAELRELLLPMLRADFEAAVLAEHRPGRTFVPLVAVAGDTDDGTGPEIMAKWADEAAGPFELRVVSGGHYLLDDEQGRAGLLREVRRVGLAATIEFPEPRLELSR
jgi:surfactin synthase thioesterase subunit